MSELPGMWDESDLIGGESDSAEDLKIVQKLKDENAALKARVAELKFALWQCVTSMLDSGYRQSSVVVRAAKSALKDPSNEA